MIVTQTSLIDFLEKAYELTVLALKLVQEGKIDELNEVLQNRERAINIIDSLSQRLSLYKESSDPKLFEQFQNQVSQVITQINNLDEIITECLETEKTKTKNEIAKTFQNKENFKGYNLNNIK